MTEKYCEACEYHLPLKYEENLNNFFARGPAIYLYCEYCGTMVRVNREDEQKANKNLE